MTDSFSVQLGRVAATVDQTSKPVSVNKPGSGQNFTDILQNVQNVKFSNHAQKRLQSRDINLNSGDVNRLSDAIDKAEKRGGKSSLVMVDDLAFIVNIQDRMVVTALDANQRGEGVFTQIDSVVFADPSTSSKKSLIDIKG
ncbi:MAG: TIGR02530 family flagellar biosynthesis protein [Chloroflexota bacterium]